MVPSVSEPDAVLRALNVFFWNIGLDRNALSFSNALRRGVRYVAATGKRSSLCRNSTSSLSIAFGCAINQSLTLLITQAAASCFDLRAAWLLMKSSIKLSVRLIEEDTLQGELTVFF